MGRRAKNRQFWANGIFEGSQIHLINSKYIDSFSFHASLSFVRHEQITEQATLEVKKTFLQTKNSNH